MNLEIISYLFEVLESLRESELPPELVPPLSVIALPAAAADEAARPLCPRLELLGSIVTLLEILNQCL